MKRLMFGILMAFWLVSVSFGAWIPEKDEANYQKLKAEMAEYDVGRECKGGGSLDEWCNLKNVIAFFDEIRARKVDCKKKKCPFNNDFTIARQEVREMPIFKNDSGIYSYTKIDNLDLFWENVWQKWEAKKSDLEIDWARRGYWKKLAE